MNDSPIRIICVVGARPNFTKIAPILRALKQHPEPFEPLLVHTGQHYDQAMKDSFFGQLDIPEPDCDLGVGSGSHALQTAAVMKRFEPVLDEQRPDMILVVGDVNSTIATALVAVKKGIPVIHVEAGLRSFDRGMPEEINRILTDQISDLLFTTEPDGEKNLLREGVGAEKIVFVGNVMIDTLYHCLDRAVAPIETFSGHPLAESVFAERRDYGVVTLHRPSNVDDPVTLRSLLNILRECSDRIPLFFPLHPRTKNNIATHQLDDLLNSPNIAVSGPVGYLQLLGLMKSAKLVLTDSGGIQEETTALGVPCITMRESTERPITANQGTNTIVGTDPGKIRSAFLEVMDHGGKSGRVPELWDGKAAGRIADYIAQWWRASPAHSTPTAE